MTEEEKRLLFRDLVARLPYTPMVNLRGKAGYDRKLVSVHRYTTRSEFEIVVNSDDDEDYMPHNFEIDIVKPYLRSMSSMTEEEMLDFHENGGALTHYLKYDIDLDSLTVSAIDWLNEHHFDYRGLIGKGLALEAPDGMYNGKNE
jgi:hypothetical protein